MHIFITVHGKGLYEKWGMPVRLTSLLFWDTLITASKAGLIPIAPDYIFWCKEAILGITGAMLYFP